MKSFNLSGKNIVVTGAGGFLGKSIVSVLALEGATVFGIDVCASENVKAVDISSDSAIESYVADLKNDGVTIHGLVNNAALSYKGNNISQEQYMKVLGVNIYGTYNCMTKFKPIFASDASVVNIASIYGLLSPDFSIYDSNEQLYSNSSYGASKAGILQLTKYYAVQFAPIRVNAVTPGGIFQGHDETFINKYSSRVPMKRLAEAEEIVNAILFLLSDLSSYITGENISVDGGLGAW